MRIVRGKFRVYYTVMRRRLATLVSRPVVAAAGQPGKGGVVRILVAIL